jgi:SAM-dependent methyltransferase
MGQYEPMEQGGVVDPTMPATRPSEPGMDPRLLGLIVCPMCGTAMRARLVDGRRVECANGHGFASHAGYVDMSEQAPDETTRRTFESFGYEWNTFDDVRDEDREFADVYFQDLDLTTLAGKRGLDAGCGKGRYTRFLAPHLEGLVALDGSSAIEAASRNLSEFGNVLAVKADVRNMPIACGTMDFVTCLGVLHHLEDPRAGFDHLVKFLAPGGLLLLYLYSRPRRLGARRVALFLARQLRRLTVMIPHRTLQALSTIVAALLYLGVVRLGGFGERADVKALARLPMANYRGKPFRSLDLDTFDRLSAPVEHRFVWEELAPWFEEAGLEVEAVRESAGWFILARRPVPA